MIAHHFPPAGGVGTFRVTKFIKYLKEFGWKPIVLTVHKDCYSKAIWLDHDLEKDIPYDIHIYRTNILRSSYINDEGIKWLPYLISNIISIIRKEHPHLVYITAGPFFPLIIGPIVKFFFQLPYVVDLRDPWKLSHRRVPIRGLKARLGWLLTNIAEPIVIRYAARVICATDALREEYQSVYSDKSEKFFTITNGYDPDDFSTIVPKHFVEFTIVYAGKFRTSEAFRDPAHFFCAIKMLQARGLKIRFIHIGRKEKEVINLAKQIGIFKFIEIIGPCSYKDTLAYAKGANLLLLIGGGQKTEQTGKIFDYIGCDRPILALAPLNSDIAKVVKKIPYARIFENKNPKVIAMAIEEIFYRYPKVLKTKIVHSNFYRKNLTSKLSGVFDDVFNRTK